MHPTFRKSAATIAAALMAAIQSSCDGGGFASPEEAPATPAAACVAPETATAVLNIIANTVQSAEASLGPNVLAEVSRLRSTSAVQLQLVTYEGGDQQIGEVRCRGVVVISGGLDGARYPVAFTRKPAADGSGFIYEVADTEAAATGLALTAAANVRQAAAQAQQAEEAAAIAEAEVRAADEAAAARAQTQVSPAQSRAGGESPMQPSLDGDLSAPELSGTVEPAAPSPEDVGG